MTKIPLRSCTMFAYLRRQGGCMFSIQYRMLCLTICCVLQFIFGKSLYEEFYINVSSIEFFLRFLQALFYQFSAYSFPAPPPRDHHVNNDENKKHSLQTEMQMFVERVVISQQIIHSFFIVISILFESILLWESPFYLYVYVLPLEMITHNVN